MIGLPDSVQSAILAIYCDGKSIASFYAAVSSSRTLRGVIFDITRDALVGRYLNLSHTFYRTQDEIRDVLDIIREEIRKSRAMIDSHGTLMCYDDVTSISELAAKRVSDWCAIIEYFDKMRVQTGDKYGYFILWIGSLETQSGFGSLHKASLSSAYWSVTAMDYLHNELELNNHYIMHPVSYDSELLSGTESYFGKLYVEDENDKQVLARIEYSLSTDPNSSRFILVPSQMEYEPTIGFSRNIYYPSRQKSLAFLWNGQDNGDFEDALSKLAENIKRVLLRLK
eukprot:CAMPEP_0176487346 /NCGR_PEP_ID=MMETSP0200_2-20121128/6078_1 /TAXON_ID=947934 /ORGANISM="Chaetoceros sp., Strain GSL56" /LENGTH=282 /DNA_ID=CAMNT_0017884159 /DNA_START=114 /DNA_END=962 /DNA_ORIENTATION=-